MKSSLGGQNESTTFLPGHAMLYTNRVPQNIPSAVIMCGFAIQFVGVVAAYQYVTDGSASAAFVWVPAGIGFLVTLAGVVMWCRRNATSLRKLAGWLLLFGGLTFCIAILGHALGVFFLVAVPALLLSAGVALAAAAATTLNKLRNHRHSHSA